MGRLGCQNLPAVGKLRLIRFEDDKIVRLSESQILGIMQMAQIPNASANHLQDCRHE